MSEYYPHESITFWCLLFLIIGITGYLFTVTFFPVPVTESTTDLCCEQHEVVTPSPLLAGFWIGVITASIGGLIYDNIFICLCLRAMKKRSL